MNRKYLVNDFVAICETLGSSVPGITLSTDIIVGFPFETDEDFAQTMRLLKSLRLDIVHYSRYYARPHTVAARFPQLPMRVVKPRVKELSDWFKGLRPYDALVDKYLCVWVSGEVEGEIRCCHTKNYTKVGERVECHSRWWFRMMPLFIRETWWLYNAMKLRGSM